MDVAVGNRGPVTAHTGSASSNATGVLSRLEAPDLSPIRTGAERGPFTLACDPGLTRRL